MIDSTKDASPSAELSKANERGVIAGGCVLAIGSALVTCLMLFINGSLVLAMLPVIASAGPSWASDRRFAQFLLFSLPVVLAVVQWMMIDYVRTRIRQRPSE